jgi:hypothetical protein
MRDTCNVTTTLIITPAPRLNPHLSWLLPSHRPRPNPPTPTFPPTLTPTSPHFPPASRVLVHSGPHTLSCVVATSVNAQARLIRDPAARIRFRIRIRISINIRIRISTAIHRRRTLPGSIHPASFEASWTYRGKVPARVVICRIDDSRARGVHARTGSLRAESAGARVDDDFFSVLPGTCILYYLYTNTVGCVCLCMAVCMCELVAFFNAIAEQGKSFNTTLGWVRTARAWMDGWMGARSLYPPDPRPHFVCLLALPCLALPCLAWLACSPPPVRTCVRARQGRRKAGVGKVLRLTHVVSDRA